MRQNQVGLVTVSFLFATIGLAACTTGATPTPLPTVATATSVITPTPYWTEVYVDVDGMYLARAECISYGLPWSSSCQTTFANGQVRRGAEEARSTDGRLAALCVDIRRGGPCGRYEVWDLTTGDSVFSFSESTYAWAPQAPHELWRFIPSDDPDHANQVLVTDVTNGSTHTEDRCPVSSDQELPAWCVDLPGVRLRGAITGLGATVASPKLCVWRDALLGLGVRGPIRVLPYGWSALAHSNGTSHFLLSMAYPDLVVQPSAYDVELTNDGGLARNVDTGQLVSLDELSFRFLTGHRTADPCAPWLDLATGPPTLPTVPYP